MKKISALIFTLVMASSIGATEGALPGRFTINGNGDQVFFSQGNLQYNIGIHDWYFAENQYDRIGEDNAKIGIDEAAVIDLFGWGTSGYNDKSPLMTSVNAYDYGDGDNDIAGTNYDWGVYNAIVNGGNTPGLWRTLTSTEWNYIANERANAVALHGPATVCGQAGYIFLSDGFEVPEGFAWNPAAVQYETNSYDAAQWAVLEPLGAVFLPAGGFRQGTEIYSVDGAGFYWQSDSHAPEYANSLNFSHYEFYVIVGTKFRHMGFSVRLVQDAPELPAGLDSATDNTSVIPHKILREGQVVILRGDETYTITGQEVK